MNDCCPVRDMYLLEEIENLEINAELKERLIRMCKDMRDEMKSLNEALSNCHRRMHWQEKAIVELGILVAQVKENY